MSKITFSDRDTVSRPRALPIWGQGNPYYSFTYYASASSRRLTPGRVCLT
jgi:hypothetical protein